MGPISRRTVLAAIAGVLLLAPPATGMAQSEETLASNQDQTVSDPIIFGRAEPVDTAIGDSYPENVIWQPFTTGAVAEGYRLTEITVWAKRHEHTVSTLMYGTIVEMPRPNRGVEIADLGVPYLFSAPLNELNAIDSVERTFTFHAPDNTHLSANTTYYLYLRTTEKIEISSTTETALDTDSHLGWTIGRAIEADGLWLGQSHDFFPTAENVGRSESIRMRVKGVPILPEVTVHALDPDTEFTEGDAVAFTLARSGSTTDTLTVNIGLEATSTGENGIVTAEAISQTTATFAANEETATVTVQTRNNETYSATPETVTISLTPVASPTSATPRYAVGTPSTAEVRIADDDPAATVTGVAVTSTAPRYREVSGANVKDVYGAGDVIEFTVTFSDLVDVDTTNGVPTLTFSLGNADAVQTSAPYARGSGTNKLVFAHAVQAADSDSNGIFLLDDSNVTGGALQRNGGVLGAGINGVVSTAIATRGARPAHKVDGSRSGPYVESLAVTSTPQIMRAGETVADTYGAGEAIEFTLALSEAVTVTGTPHLQFSLGGTNTHAGYARGSGTDKLVFAYAVQAGDADADGIFVQDGEDVSGNSAVVLDTGEAIAAMDDSADADLVNPGRGTRSGHRVDGSMSVFDTAAPTVLSIVHQDPADSPTNADTLTWRVTFSEDVANVDAADFTLTGTTATPAVDVASASTVFDVTASGGDLAELDGTVTLGFAPGQDIADTADTPNALADTAPTGTDERSYDLDNTAPTVTITVPETSDAPFMATFTFAEPVTGFTVEDITVGNGTASEFTNTETGTTWTAKIAPGADGEVTVDVAADAAADAAGNGSLAATRQTVDHDATAPTVLSVVRHDPVVSPTNADALTWRVTFSEDVQNVDAADFAVTGSTATVTGVQAVSGETGVHDVTASGGNLAGYSGTVTLGFGSGQDIADEAGNALTDTAPAGTDERSWVVDNTAPTVTIGDVPATSDGPFTATFAFSEAVTGFTVEDITVGNGTASDLAGGDGDTVYTATITPTADGEVTVDVAADVAQDEAGNGNAAAAQASSAHAAPNTPPAARDGMVTTEEDTPYPFTAGDFNFTDADSGDTLASVKITQLESAGDLELDGTDVTLDQVIQKADIDAGKLVFSPAANANGTGYATFRYRVNDGTDDSDAEYTMAVDVNAVNDAPAVANPIPNQSATAGAAFSFTVPDDAFEDVDGDTLTYTATQGDDSGLPDWLAFDAATRTFTGTPGAGDTGTLAVEVTAEDGDGETASDAFDIVVNAAPNAAPAFADAALTRSVAENAGPGTNVGAAIPPATDGDGDALTYAMGGADAASFDFDATTRQVATKAGVDYDFEAQAMYSVTIEADDGKGGTATVAVTITLTDVAEPPDAPEPPAVTATPGSTTSLDVSWSAPANTGRPDIAGYDLRYCAGQAVDCTADSDFTDGPQDVTGTSAAIPGLAEGTAYQVQVRASNDEGDSEWSMSGDGSTAMPVNTPPTASDGEVTAEEDTPYAFSVADFNFDDADAGDTLASVRITALPATGSLELDGTAVTMSDVIDKDDIDADKLTYAPPPDANGTGYASFGFRVSDGTSESSASYTMTINVTAVNDAPTFPDATLTRSIAENTGAGENVGDPIPEASDPDSGDTLGYTLEGTDAGSFELDGTSRQIKTKAGISYDFEAKASYSVTVKAEDAEGESDTVAVTISVTNVIEAPQAPGTPEVTAPAGSTTSLDVSWTAPDNDGRPAITGYDIRYCRGPPTECTTDSNYTNGPQGVTATSATLTGLATKTAYQVQVRAKNADGDGAWSEPGSGATANSPPTAQDAEVETAEDETHAFSASEFRFADADDGDTLASIRVTSLPATGSLKLDGSEVTMSQVVTRDELDADKLTYTPPPDANGTGYASFGFKVSDGLVQSTENYTMTIDVTAVNDAPAFTGTSLTRSLAENSEAGEPAGDPIPEATDPDAGDTLSYELEGTDAASFDFDGASRQISAKSGVAYDFENKTSYSVTVKADDGNGGTDTLEVTIEVTNVAETPQSPDAPSVTATPDTPLSLDVSWTAPASGDRPPIAS